MPKKLKVAIFTPGVGNRGGVERIVLLMAKKFYADIFTGRYYPEQTFSDFKKLKISVLDNTKLPRRIQSLIIRYKFKKLKVNGYDVHFYHGGHSLAAAKNHKNNIWYCHAPTRWLYDLYEEELLKFNPLKRIIFRIVSSFIRRDDQKNIKNIDLIISNSRYTQKRVKKYYNRSSSIVYPPVNLSKFNFMSYKNYYLSAARVDPIKRIYLIVKAFQKMPNKKLIVASGGPDLSNINKMASNYQNIEVLGWVSDKELRKLLGECTATIYMGYKEDFGMIPIESMSAGKPCIAANEGGMRETIIHKKTGILINANENSIRTAVNWMTLERAKSMKKACQERAKLFSEQKYLNEIQKAILSLNQRQP